MELAKEYRRRETDWYSTGLVTYVMKQAGRPQTDPIVARGRAWLVQQPESHQRNVDNHVAQQTTGPGVRCWQVNERRRHRVCGPGTDSPVNMFVFPFLVLFLFLIL